MVKMMSILGKTGYWVCRWACKTFSHAEARERLLQLLVGLWLGVWLFEGFTSADTVLVPDAAYDAASLYHRALTSVQYLQSKSCLSASLFHDYGLPSHKI